MPVDSWAILRRQAPSRDSADARNDRAEPEPAPQIFHDANQLSHMKEIGWVTSTPLIATPPRVRLNRKGQEAEFAVARSALPERDERARGLFRDERLVHLDELVRVELNGQHGYVNSHELAAAQADRRYAAQDRGLPEEYQDALNGGV